MIARQASMFTEGLNIHYTYEIAHNPFQLLQRNEVARIISF